MMTSEIIKEVLEWPNANYVKKVCVPGTELV